ncbi:MAG: hypothetical protein A2W31_03315 [Planctomycetes bacterium RBG_16_64_10]|nr:MAG: hypothetical protein A2W31_03315 [Planctomycetes bacterium RBG_16_64_10]
MPANLTPQYLKAEEVYRRAATPEEELRALQQMLRELPKHKGTDKLQAELKQKISKAKKESQTPKRSGGRKGHGARIAHQGAGSVVVLGAPNAGKSQLVRSLTNAKPEVAAYPFTTRQPLPAMMPWEDVMVQLIDTPPITPDHLEVYMQGIIRGANLALLLISLGDDHGMEQARAAVDRLDTTKTRLARTSSLDENDLGVSYTKSLLVPTMIDLPEAADRLAMLPEFCPLDLPQYVVSAAQGTGLAELRDAIYTALDVVRVYSKLPTVKQPDFDRPYTLPRGGTVLDMAQMIHNDFATKLKFARVWGTDVHDGTTVKGDYVLHDKDVVELHV